MAKITGISRESIVRKILKKGDDVVAFSDRPFEDVLDYIYADSCEQGKINFVRNGIEQVVEYEKDSPDETLGLEFDESIEITPKTCCNNCIFCFVSQLPDGLRDTLYVKDDDYRLSFISGSYITCTNLREKDIQRIIDYKLSPLYVSVHATDTDVRKFMLGIKKCADQLEQIKRFVDNGIVIHAQIVLVAGINDGEILKKSLLDLYNVGVSTVAIVPVGLTTHRQGKYEISPLTKEQAGEAIDICESFYKAHVGFCYCSDEMYQIACREVRDASYYGQYEQIENGVGLIPKFFDELECALEMAPTKVKKRAVGVFTGVSGFSTMQKAKEMVESAYDNVKVNIYVVKNDFFGRTVTVTGLVTATDIIKQYQSIGKENDYFVIPSVMLKEFEDVFLDNKSVKELSKALSKKVIVAECTGEGYLKAVLVGDKKWQNR